MSIPHLYGEGHPWHFTIQIYGKMAILLLKTNSTDFIKGQKECLDYSHDGYCKI